MDWSDILRRVDAGEQLEDILDAEHLKDREEFRSFLADMGERGADALKRYDERVRAGDLGIDRAQATWHSISDAQRRVVALVGKRDRLLQRADGLMKFPGLGKHYFVVDTSWAHVPHRHIGIATVRNLASRELLEWTGGAFDPEASAIATEKLHFILRHGPRTDIPNPWTSSPKPVPAL